MNPSSKMINYVKQVSTHAIQEYLNYMVIEIHGADETWKTKAFEYAVKKANDRECKYRTSYTGVAGKIAEKGTEDFSVFDWDITALRTVFAYMKPQMSLPFIPDEIFDLIKSITRDKNFDSHDSTNQTVEEVLPWTESALDRTARFIEAVSSKSSLSPQDRAAFLQSQTAALEEARKEIRMEYDEKYAEEQRNILRVKEYVRKTVESPDMDGEYLRVTKRLIDDYTGDHDILYFYLMHLYDREMADLGYDKAAEKVGDAFFYGEFEAQDYEMAAYYYEKVELQYLHPHAQLNLASIYMNNLSARGDVAVANEIIAGVREAGKKSAHPFTVERYENGDYTFYR